MTPSLSTYKARKMADHPVEDPFLLIGVAQVFPLVPSTGYRVLRAYRDSFAYLLECDLPCRGQYGIYKSRELCDNALTV